MTNYKFLATKNQRIDKEVATNISITREQAIKIIKSGQVKIRNKKNAQVIIKKPSEKVQANQEIEVYYKEEKIEIKAKKVDIEIIYEDEHIIILNKPANLITHPAKDINEISIVNFLLSHCKTLGNPENNPLRPGIVHRLDKKTTGLIICAKTDEAHKILSQQLKRHKITRKYLALQWGFPLKVEEKLQTYVYKDNKKNFKVISTLEKQEIKQKKAISNYKVIKTYKRILSLVEWQLETGRTHQIRSHAEFIGNNIFADNKYQIKSHSKLVNYKEEKEKVQKIAEIEKHLNQHFLHSYKLEFEHPITKEALFFEIELNQGLQETLKKVEGIIGQN